MKKKTKPKAETCFQRGEEIATIPVPSNSVAVLIVTGLLGYCFLAGPDDAGHLVNQRVRT